MGALVAVEEPARVENRLLHGLVDARAAPPEAEFTPHLGHYFLLGAEERVREDPFHQRDEFAARVLAYGVAGRNRRPWGPSREYRKSPLAQSIRLCGDSARIEFQQPARGADKTLTRPVPHVVLVSEEDDLS